MLFIQVWASLLLGAVLAAIVGLVQLSLGWVRHRRFYNEYVSRVIPTLLLKFTVFIRSFINFLRFG
jgi:hypothetical protein